MIRRLVLLAALLMCTGLAWGQVPVPPVDLKSAQVIAEGESVFNRRCAGKCHGLDAHAGEDAPTLHGKGYLSPMFVYATVAFGRPGTAMPPWNDRLSNVELWQVVAYVASLQAP